MAHLAGIIDDVVFSNDENGYSIVSVITDTGDAVTLTGTIPFPGKGERLEAEGNYVQHPVYGSQFKSTQIERSLPSDESSIMLFLGSGTIKGVGLVSARRIVNTFGSETMRIIEEEPQRLSEVKGITPKKASEIGNNFRKNHSVRALTDFLSGSSLDPSVAMELYRRYGDEALQKILINPYILLVLGLTENFRAVDILAGKQGIASTSDRRIEAGLLYLMMLAKEEGHVCLPEKLLLNKAHTLLSIAITELQNSLKSIVEAALLIREQTDKEILYYLPHLYLSECHVAEQIIRLSGIRYRVPKGLVTLIEQTETKLLITYSSRQIEALRTAAECGLMILTGGPGTGKTTVIRGIISMLELLGAKVLLAAPTGRAAKRMSELCQTEAKTIHRLLEVSVDNRGELLFNRNANNLLECDAVILDELSMVDIELMSSFLAALPPTARLILVGDADQLPSVGAGNVLSDLLKSNIISTVHLDEIFRQAQGSHIITGAHLVNHGNLPLLHEKEGDLFFLRRTYSLDMEKTVVELITNRLPTRLGIPSSDIQVLLPNRRGDGGIEELNPILQAAINPPSKEKHEVKTLSALFREGDRVMQTSNNYEMEWRKNNSIETGIGVYNGDTGIITAIRPEEKQVIIRFDDRTAVYNFDLLDQIELSYATTVHKAQGSEYPVVIFGATLTHSRLLTRSLFYTAMTRAKKMLILVGLEESIESMVCNNTPSIRFGLLEERLRNSLPKTK